MPNKDKQEPQVNADDLVGNDAMPVCEKCGCVIVLDGESGESLCNCTFGASTETSPERPPEAPETAQDPNEDQPLRDIKEILAELPGAPSQAQINEWKRRHTEGLRKAPFVICPHCEKKTRMRKNGRFHCRFCKSEFWGTRLT